MLDFISKDVQKYMAENGLEFSDFEKATVIYNSALSIKEKHEALERLASETSDAALKEQIADRLHDDRQAIEAFKNNTEGCIYVVYDNGEEDHGYFADLQTACMRGMTLGCEFGIEKIEIACFRKHFEKHASGRIKDYTDLYSLVKQDSDLFSCIEKSDRLAGFYYRSDGTLYDFWSFEIKREDEAVPNRFANGRFEYSSVNMPNPFEKGDIVRFMETGDYGIVEMSHDEWSSSLECGNDYFDSYIKILLFYSNGRVDHLGRSPILLEKYEPKEDDGNYETLMLGKEAYIGNIPLLRFLNAVEQYEKDDDE